MKGARIAPIATLATTLALPLLLLTPGCLGQRRPNILLVVADTARADRFLQEGERAAVAPRVAALAQGGAAYLDARSPSPWTLPAHASLFTGLYPSSHGAEAGHLKLREDAPFLAERLRRAGYRTQAYIANPWVAKDYNFHVGFDTFDEVWRAVKGTEGEMGAEAIVGKIARWLDWRAGNDDAKAKPFFVFVNFFEPHLPYNPPEPERSRLLPPGADSERIERLRRFKHPDEVRAILGQTRLDAADRRVLAALYDGEVAYADRRIGDLVDLLEARGLLDDTVVAVTSDHGEMLGEHGLYDHKLSLYEPVLRIPLVLRYPARVEAGQRIASSVMLQDLYPTLLALAGVEPGPSQEARRLPGIRGLKAGPIRGTSLDDPIVAEYARPAEFLPVMRELAPGADLSHWDAALVAFTYGTRKLVWSSAGPAELYDLAADPGESEPIAASGPQEEIASNRAADRAARLAQPPAAAP
ncbi:MAG TPA: sulfatase-like hydrolase/transferase [Candidatus Polarisedimenticolia bacterium]|nr:sulfatase-like hydrolase/transferase [Candidatus Polarisedimenticolia bacterium]